MPVRHSMKAGTPWPRYSIRCRCWGGRRRRRRFRLHEVQASLRRRRDRVLGRVGVLRSRGRTRPFRQCAGHGRFRRDRGNGPAAGLTWTPPRRSRAAGSTAHLSGGRMHHRPRQRRRGALYGRLSFTRSSSPPRPRAPSSLQRLTIFGSDRGHSGHF